MKKIFLAILIILFAMPFVSVYAQEVRQESQEQVVEIKAEAGSDKNVIVNRQVSFSSIGSVVQGEVGEIKYVWNLGDGTVLQGEEIVHTYSQAGVYRVKMIISGKHEENELVSEDEIIVNVDKDILVLITDQSVDDKQLSLIQNLASSQGILLVKIQETENQIDYVAEKELAQKIIKNKDEILQAGGVVIWTSGNMGVNSFLEAGQVLSAEDNGTKLSDFGFQNKHIVVITEQNFTAAAKLSQNLYNILEPQFIVLTHEAAKDEVFLSSNINDLLTKLQNSETDYKLVGLHTKRELSEKGYWNFLSRIVSYMVDRGVPLNTIYLILVLPVIATILAFTRQVIGIKALGIYAPSIVAVSFLSTGLEYGLLIFLITLLVGTLTRIFARKVRLSYLPRMANVLILVSFAVLFMFWVGAYLGKSSMISISVFPILIMVLLTEKFINAQIERGSKAAVVLVLETLMLSMACYFLANWQTLRIFVLAYPELVLLTIIINILIGKWKGLRLLEYYRFRKVIKNVELLEKK